ncbi:MAG: hypothetical protein V3U72_01560 [Candidatus Aenigmarchaeota archaeon]
MDIDWIVGIFVFIIFVGWSFSFYLTLFEKSENQFEIAARMERGKIMDFLLVDVYEVPVKCDSPGAVNNGILNTSSIWYHGEKNSTKVFSGSELLPCRISGDNLYWQANLTNGFNYFRIQIADVNETMNCSGTFGISASNLTIPWVFERNTMISLTKINEMNNMNYDVFRDSLGLNEDFMIKVDMPGGDTDIDYGKSIPSGPLNVNSKEMGREIFETLEIANITVAVW